MQAFQKEMEAKMKAHEEAAQAEAAKAKATLGEMCDVLRGVFGEYREGSDF